MGLDIGGYEQRPDWPKMGPSLLIAACLVLAIRTAKWPPRSTGAPPQTVRGDRERGASGGPSLECALVSHHETIFPRKKAPWFVANGEDTP
jgi:hypothetical protein